MSHIYNPKKMLMAFLLVQLSKNGPLHGYALATILEKKFGWKASMTSIYNILKQMEADKTVVVEEQIEKNRVQKIYSITDKGREALKNIQQQFREKMRNNLSHFFSILEEVDYFNPQKEEPCEALNEIFALLRKIVLMIISITNKTDVDLDILKKVLNQTFSSLTEIAEEHNLSITNINES